MMLRVFPSEVMVEIEGRAEMMAVDAVVAAGAEAAEVVVAVAEQIQAGTRNIEEGEQY